MQTVISPSYTEIEFFVYCDSTCKNTPFGVCLKFIAPFVSEIFIFEVFGNLRKSSEIQIKPTVSAPKRIFKFDFFNDLGTRHSPLPL